MNRLVWGAEKLLDNSSFLLLVSSFINVSLALSLRYSCFLFSWKVALYQVLFIIYHWWQTYLWLPDLG